VTADVLPLTPAEAAAHRAWLDCLAVDGWVPAARLAEVNVLTDAAYRLADGADPATVAADVTRAIAAAFGPDRQAAGLAAGRLLAAAVVREYGGAAPPPAVEEDR
jgi:hypothetical protein